MTEISFGIVPIHEATGDILLVESLEGKWGFPKGHKESGDADNIAAALRELREETGVADCEVRADQAYEDAYTYERDGIVHEKTVYYYAGLVTDRSVTPQLSEVRNARWFPYEEAITRLGFDGAKRILSALTQR